MGILLYLLLHLDTTVHANGNLRIGDDLLDFASDWMLQNVHRLVLLVLLRCQGMLSYQLYITQSRFACCPRAGAMIV